VIRQLLPPGAAAGQAFSDIRGAGLFPAEEAQLSGASAERRAEFATGRACARAALAALGLPAAGRRWRMSACPPSTAGWLIA
jgi:4'-phosphopantetheinyl transferase EntD